ncbi:MAG: hypothetical protein COA78_25015 [Blastopirellula sp.]|nr:MAG: hypothetical protein COA78_25015 [Blastopirellula sp.]
MNPSDLKTREPLTDSPWFWLYLFATFAIITMVFIGPKYQRRQSDIENQHHARQAANMIQMGQQPAVIVADQDTTIIGFEALYAVLGVLLAVGWFRLWYTRFRITGADVSSSPPSTE